MEHLTVEQKRAIHRLRGRGLSLRQVAREVGCTAPGVVTVLARTPVVPARPDRWLPGPCRLQPADREEISLGLLAGLSLTAIAHSIGRSPSTVSREVAANGGSSDYRAWRAHQHAYVAARRPKVAKLAHRPLAKLVSTWPNTWWSPDQIAKRLRIEFPDDPMMQASYETIYQSLFVQGRGELHRELASCLRSGQVQRRRKDHERPKGELPNMVTIAERPAEVEHRAVLGHWEGDLVCGSHNRSAVGTLVERQTRYVMLLHLPDSHEATAVQAAMEKAIKTMPAALFKTLTWDRGKEMARHVDIKVATGVQVYFSDPHSPPLSGRGIQMRTPTACCAQYMPKGTDLSTYSAKDLNRIAALLNERPRKTLGYMNPSEKLAELVAMTA
jgi:transposase, IS30 family